MFIIDQSGSMGGTRYSGDDIYGLGNDPQDLRFYAPQYTIQWLSSFLLATPDVYRPTVNISMVTFGTVPRPILYWMDMETEYLDATDDGRGKLLEDISAVRFYDEGRGVYTNLGFTNFREAFKAGNTLFNDAPRSSDVGRPYLSAVIVLTDGAPCIPEQNCDNLNPDGFPVGHLNNLLGEVQSNYPNTEIFVVGLDALDEFFPTLETYWQSIICAALPSGSPCDALHLKQVRTEAETGSQFNDILSYLFDRVAPTDLTSVVLSPPDRFFVPPYTQLLRVGIFKSIVSPLGTDVVILTKPDGTRVTSSEMDEIGLDTLIEAREIILPTSGEWAIDVTDMSSIESINYRANFINASADMEINGVSGADLAVSGNVLTLSAYQNTPLQLRIINGSGGGSGAALIEDPNYPLTVTAHIYDATQPDPALRPRLESVNLPRDPAFVDTAVYLGNWIPLGGKYEIRVDATYVHPVEGDTPLLSDFSVYDGIQVNPIDFQALNLPTNSYLQGETLVMGALATDHESGLVLSQPLTRFGTLVTLVDDKNNVVLDQNFIPNASTNNGEVSAPLQVNDPGVYSATAQVVYLDETDTPQAVNALPTVYNFTVRPIQELTLSVSLNPSESKVDAHHLGLSPEFPFVGIPNPVLVVVQVKNELTGQPVSVSQISGGAVQSPTLNLQTSDTTQDLTDQLTETQAGVYTVELDDLQTGDFNFVALANVPENQLIADHTWRISTMSVPQERGIARFFYLLGAGTVGILAIVLAAGLIARGVIVEESKKPKMVGNLELLFIDYDNHEEIVDTIVVEGARRYKYTPRKGVNVPFSHLVLVAPPTIEQSLNGVVIVEKAIVEGKNILKSNLRISGSGDPERLYVPRDGTGFYQIRKDIQKTLRFDQDNGY